MLKATCDRLSAGSTKKETEIQELNDHLQKSNLQVSDFINTHLVVDRL